ncbi:MAG: CvpA family protein [Woeseiaceae bacterium]|nr:CvpA family protein [Woeseiaceae bacterium]
MPIIDIIIAVAIVISIIVGLIRGFVKEAISIGALVFAIWAALYFGPSVGGVSENWFSSEELQMWFGRILVFLVILALGGLLGWGISKIVRLSALSGTDRFLGAVFGVVRGILLVAVAVIGGQFAGFDNDEWWLQSKLIPHLEVVAEWIKVIAPEGLDLITPDKQMDDGPASGPLEV